MTTRPSLPSFYNETRAARKIIVVDLGFLGDSIHLIPALWEIKGHYPQAEVHTLSAPVGAKVLKLAPCVDRAWTFPLGPQSPAWWRHWDMIRALRRERFDLAFNFSGADRAIFLTALTGARWRLAQSGTRDHFWKTWLIGDWVPRRSGDLPVFEQRRQTLALAGCELAAPKFDLKLDDAARAWAEQVIPPRAIHLSINASTHLKEWPLAHWIALAKTLLAEDSTLHLIATGSAAPREQARLQSLTDSVANNRLRVLNSLTIPQLAAALARCRLHVGADSGVLHLALALNVPTLSLFRDYAGWKEWAPRGLNHRHLIVPCPCANQKNPACAVLDYARCLAEIQPAQVMQLLREGTHGTQRKR
ncbi:MAG: glycosyltransferase family 9 protein [Verrucomicrobia bacterium]|nr:glycosyltransferase family 9 protein [Verrucomicrobiota bacterium]